MISTNRRVAYYPGCSVKTIEIAYNDSTEWVARALGIELDELKNYNCCGGGEMKSLGDVGLLFPVRNLMLAQELGHTEVVIPCSIGYHELSRAQSLIAQHPDRLERVNQMLSEAGEPTYRGGVAPRHFLEYLFNEFPLETFRGMTKRPLQGLKVGAYYGCLYSRPSQFTGTDRNPKLDNAERPFFMHRVLETVGCTMVTYGNEVSCCGGKNLLQDEEVAFRLDYETLSRAKRAGADMIALICPKCAGGLDTNQAKIIQKHGEEARLPVVFVTQLLGLAMGASAHDMKLKEMMAGAYGCLQQKRLA
ncbi:MAG: CoB--CoM heterodisulfide reductase iron-sulfur subunit B family protein [Nitrospirae bacterium]|nr:CoB--CoM heterodisulfide reductase iron-sulfur subunit B family protein [Nitrospirota bacterium]